MSEIQIVTSGLQFPEGPIALADGSVLVVEMRGGTLKRVLPEGTHQVIAHTGGCPNGAAKGPEGKVYICDNGGLGFLEADGIVRPNYQTAESTGGCILRVDLSTGQVEKLYTHCGDLPLMGPNDIVFDSTGGFWFTDFGKIRERDRDRTGVFYAQPDGQSIREVIFPLDSPNGIGLSPDERTLYVAETFTGRLFAWDLSAPGVIKPLPRTPHGGRLVVGLPGMQLFDSLAVDAEGNVCLGTLASGGITIVSPDGKQVEFLKMPDPFPTNLCFGGSDLSTAYITLSGTGRLAAVPWKTPGLRLAF